MVDSISVLLAIGLCLTAGMAICPGQTYTPPPPLTTLPPCPTIEAAKAAKKKAKKNCDPANVLPAPAVAPQTVAPPAGSAEQKFPYPGDTNKPTPNAAKAFPYPGEDTSGRASEDGTKDSVQQPSDVYRADPNVQHDPAAEKKAAATPAGKAFPYPGDPAPQSEDGSQPAAGEYSPDSSSSSATSSSSSDDDDPNTKAATKDPTSDDDQSPDKPRFTDKGSEGKRNRKTIKPQTATDRVDEDLSVAKFYSQSGNAMGAYLRAKDATQIEPDYPEAHFALGEAAKRLNKRDEARTEFAAYLKLAPAGEKAKAAEKALAELP